jgi:hypothetical protein
LPQSPHPIPKSRAPTSNRGSYRFPAFREADVGGRSTIKQPDEVQFRRPPKLGDGNSVLSDDEADARSAKIARLRELRLARDTAALAAPHAEEPGKSKN